jgi:hypothetical protein
VQENEEKATVIVSKRHVDATFTVWPTRLRPLLCRKRNAGFVWRKESTVSPCTYLR